MRILIVNDDGYFAKGLTMLADRLSAEHKITVVAPTINHSGMSHAIHFHRPINLKLLQTAPYKVYALGGTPSDCVKLGVELLRDEPPELIISGMNDDYNLGTDVVYSGTANAAVEGSLCGFKAIAFSSAPRSDEEFEYAIDYIVRKLSEFFALSSEWYALNVNISVDKRREEYKLTPLGIRKFVDEYICAPETEEGAQFTLVGDPAVIENSCDCDVTWLAEGYTTVTPLGSDYTDRTALCALKKKFGGSR